MTFFVISDGELKTVEPSLLLNADTQIWYQITCLWYRITQLRYQSVSTLIQNYSTTVLTYLLRYQHAQLRYQIIEFWFHIAQLRYWNTHFDINMLIVDIEMLNDDIKVFIFDSKLLNYVLKYPLRYQLITQLRYWNTHFDIKLLNYNSNVFMSINNYFNKMSINEKIVRSRLLHTGISPSSSKYLYDMTCLQLWCQPACV
jgi:hypothetical protein